MLKMNEPDDISVAQESPQPHARPHTRKSKPCMNDHGRRLQSSNITEYAAPTGFQNPPLQV